MHHAPRTVCRGDVGHILCSVRGRLYGEDEVPFLEFLNVALQNPLFELVEEVVNALSS
jgi:hypothetical protein